MSSTSRSLVLGLAARLPPASLRPFIDSLRATSFRGRIALVVAQYSSDDLATIRNMVDHVHDVSDQYADVSPSGVGLLGFTRSTKGFRRFYPPLFVAVSRLTTERKSNHSWRELEYRLEGLQSLRYAHYYDVVRALEPDQILLSDVRDVIFQRDPFDPPLNELEIALEDDAVRIGTSPFNRRWIEDLYGEVRARDLADSVVSCSGTVLGTQSAMLHYLKEMAVAVEWRRRPLGPHDQGIHNHLLRSGRLDPVAFIVNGAGRVITMGEMTQYSLSADGEVLNPDGTVPSIVHQYDRHPELAQKIWSKLS